MLFVVAIFLLIAIFWVISLKKEPESPVFATIESSNKPVSYVFSPSPDNLKIIKALLHLGKADGQLRDNEAEFIINYLVRAQPEHTGTPAWYLLQCIREIKAFTAEEHTNFLDDLDKSSLEKYLTWMNLIFKTQKKNHPYEDILLADLKSRIAHK